MGITAKCSLRIQNPPIAASAWSARAREKAVGAKRGGGFHRLYLQMLCIANCENLFKGCSLPFVQTKKSLLDNGPFGSLIGLPLSAYIIKSVKWTLSALTEDALWLAS